LLDVGFFLSEMDVRLDVAGDGRELLVRGDLFFGSFPLAENTLCGFLIVPETGIGDARFESLQRSRYCGASKIAPHERDALLEAFVTVLQIFENHAFFW